MAAEYCSACGKTHDVGFHCPARSDIKTEPGSPPAVIASPVVATPAASRPFSSSKSESGPITRLNPGTLVGEYHILDRIGEGGMGTVYSAVHPIIGKKVAIKVLAGRLAKNQNAIKRFVLEARAVNEIGHPALVDIFSFGRLTDGRHYYVMEFLEGRSLGAMLRTHQRLAPQAAHPVFVDIGRALVAVHGHGIVHRDLKPDNVILMPQGANAPPKVKLVDFGLAKLLEADEKQNVEGPHTAVGVNVGTPHYMSPEQCRGGKVDARSDLYALGIMFYETLTGRLPFDGPTPLDIWQAHAEMVPRSPHQLVPGEVSPELSALVMKLLAKKPEHRPQSAAEFCEALEALAAARRLGTGQSVTPGAGVEGNMLDLARALSSTPVSADLVCLDAAVDAQVGRLSAPSAPVPPPAAKDVAAVLRDVPAIQLPDSGMSPAERTHEIDDLRAALGLQIEEPAYQEAQVSALVINLEAASAAQAAAAGPGAGRMLAGTPGAPRPVLLGRPIEERQHLPQLSAPRRPATTGVTGVARIPSRTSRLVRGGLMVLAVLAATAAALWLGL